MTTNSVNSTPLDGMSGGTSGGAIKLFVGQVPSSWEEKDLRPVMEVFGQISDMIILKDKLSGISKGQSQILVVFLIRLHQY